MQKFIKPLLFGVCSLPAVWWVYAIWQAYAGNPGLLGPDPPKYLSLESGEWSMRMLVGALAITPLRYLFNWPYLWRLRRMIGLFVFFYATLHFLVFLVLILGLNWADLGRELAERPYITLGFGAYVILCLLAMTSFNYAQRKMGRNWKRLHRAVYVAAILAVLHLIWIVRSDFGEALLYSLLFAILLLYRLLHKVNPAFRRFTFR
jgi:sulfoxide reductase heme-binding subunit YedZ